MKIYSQSDTSKQHLIKTVLDEYFVELLQEHEVVFYLVKLFTSVTPILLTINDTYQLVIDPVLDFAISNDMDYVSEYLSNLQSVQVLEDSCQIKEMDPNLFDSQVQELQSQDKKPQSLAAIKCQIFFKLVPEKAYQTINYLELKVKFMPNLMRVSHLPSYVTPVLASSLKEAKSESDLQTMFSDLTKSQIDRAFLLCILTDIADMNVLLVSYKNRLHLEKLHNNNAKKIRTNKTHLDFKDTLISEKIKKVGAVKTVTEELKRATKTGFFSRLLKKLSA